MKPSEFADYKRRYGAAMHAVLAEAEPGRLDEIGFPAYSHANPLIKWLFWKRIHTVMDYLEAHAPFERGLDFGCGSGVMLPFLSTVCTRVVAADVDLVPLERMKSRMPLSANVTEWNLSGSGIAQGAPASFDLIVALDVLEHVQDLQGTLQALLRLLRKGRQLVVSGPTENILYRFGRRLAGPEYSGEYHERGIAEIRHALKRSSRVSNIATLYWPVPLFEIFAATA